MSKAKVAEGFRKKNFDGKPAQDVWRETLMRNHRCKCGALPIGYAAMFCPAADFEREFPRLAIQYATENKGSIPIVKFNSSGTVRPFVAMPVLYACRLCWAELEKMTAKRPSYMVVEFHKGPGQDKVVGQVPRGAN